MAPPPISQNDAFAGDEGRGRDQQVPSLGGAPDGMPQPARWLDRAAWQAAGFEAGRAGVDSDFGFFWGTSRRIRVSFLPTTAYTYNRATETHTTGLLYAYDPARDVYALLARQVTYGAVDAAMHERGRRVFGGDLAQFAHRATTLDTGHEPRAAASLQDGGPPRPPAGGAGEPAEQIDGPYSASVREQLVRFAAPERLAHSRGFRSFRAAETVAARAGHMSFRAREVVTAAEEGSSEQLRKALAALSHREDRYMQRSESWHLIAALDGDLGSLGYMLVHSESLMALSRTAAKRAMGIDMAEVATTDGLHVLATAVDPGAGYEVRVLVPAEADATPRRLNTAAMADGRLWDYDTDTDTERATLTSSVVAATSAHEALRAAVSTELEIGGLGRRDARELITQVERAETLESARTGVGGVTALTAQGVDAQPTRGLDRWAGLVSDLVDADVVHNPGWPSLAAALDRAHEAGWDVPVHLPRLAQQTPLPRDPCAELQYRVMDACPQAIPPPSSTAHTDAPAARSSGRARQEAEVALQHSPPPPRHGRAVGR